MAPAKARLAGHSTGALARAALSELDGERVLLGEELGVAPAGREPRSPVGAAALRPRAC